MTGKIVDFPLGLNEGETRLDLVPDQVLQSAIGKLKEAVIVGYAEDGSFWFSSTRSDGPQTLWLLAQAQRKLLEISE
jgi:hypothetical protein